MVRRFTKHIFLTTLILLVVVFVTGILLGRSFGSAREDQITRSMRNNELNAESFLIEQELFKTLDESSCELAGIRLTELSKELGQTGRALIAEDAQKQLGEENFQFLKRKYHLMQIRAYLLFDRLMRQCNMSSNVILYYYGTDDQYSQEQGYILDQIVEYYDVSVFAVEYNYSRELNFLESYYNVTETPFIVVNYVSRHPGLTDYETIAPELRR